MAAINFEPIPSGLRIQIMSDLHLETPKFFPMYSQFNVNPKAPYLALLGDIGNADDARLFQFLEQQLLQFKVVFYVLGNHEPYQSEHSTDACTYHKAISTMSDFEASINARREAECRSQGSPSMGEFILLDRKRVDLANDVTILGCSLFSQIDLSQLASISLFVSDFSEIESWTVDAHNAAHKRDLEWLNDQVATISRDEPHRKIVVLTHYSPTRHSEANDPKHLKDFGGVQSAFSTNLADEPCWTSPLVKIWAFGHTHYNCDFVEEGTGKRIIANQRGYGREERFDFDGDKVVVLPES